MYESNFRIATMNTIPMTAIKIFVEESILTLCTMPSCNNRKNLLLKHKEISRNLIHAKAPKRKDYFQDAETRKQGAKNRG